MDEEDWIKPNPVRNIRECENIYRCMKKRDAENRIATEGVNECSLPYVTIPSEIDL